MNEGCGRTKLFWAMALADSRTLKAMVEFKDVGGESYQRLSVYLFVSLRLLFSMSVLCLLVCLFVCLFVGLFVSLVCLFVS